jgi:hypothetical protein
MTRLTLALAVWIGFVSVGWASLAPRKESEWTREVSLLRNARHTAKVLDPTAAREARPQFNVTKQTEVLLNGKPCRYQDVPSHATIIQMEVAADKKTVLRVYFRTQK